ncbi:hypothetical protein K469DRAFT_506477, partial [Zopfia rhizophila CBS 207.26]
MADPLSIAASVVTLLQVSIQVSVLLKRFRDDVNVVDATLTGLLQDVEGLGHVLESMKETFNEETIKANLQDTGHVGCHWRNLSRSLKDGAATLDQLHAVLDGVNKTTSLLDRPRKQIRFKSAMDQIATYRSQVQSYRDALQLSLSTVILWNQVTFQKSTDTILPNLDKLYDEFRKLGIILNSKIENLQTIVSEQNDRRGLDTMSNLRECIRSAAAVVSSASTTLAVEKGDQVSIRLGSDFGDIFHPDTNETMRRWMDSNTVYEYEDPDPPSAQTALETREDGQHDANYPSDSDSDIETEMITALLKNGKKFKEDGLYEPAERRFRNCLSRLNASASRISLHHKSRVSKLGILELLMQTQCLQEHWSDAKSTLTEMISIKERQTVVGKTDERLLWDYMRLAELMLNNNDEYVEAHLQARRALRGFKKM